MRNRSNRHLVLEFINTITILPENELCAAAGARGATLRSSHLCRGAFLAQTVTGGCASFTPG